MSTGLNSFRRSRTAATIRGDGSTTSRRLDNLLCCGGSAHGRGVARRNLSPNAFQFSRHRTRLHFSICLPLHPRSRIASLSAHKFVRGPDLSRVVGRADLHADRSDISPLTHGCVHGAAGFSDSNIGFARADRRPASGENTGQPMARISRLDVDRGALVAKQQTELSRGRRPDPDEVVCASFDELFHG